LKHTGLENDVITVIPPNFDRKARIAELKAKLLEDDN